MTEREVIARRAKAPRFLYLFTALFGLAFAGVAAWLGFTTGAPMGYLLIIFVLAGFFFTGISLFYFIKGMKTPEEIAVREGEMLTFLGQTFPLKRARERALPPCPLSSRLGRHGLVPRLGQAHRREKGRQELCCLLCRRRRGSARPSHRPYARMHGEGGRMNILAERQKGAVFLAVERKSVV